MGQVFARNSGPLHFCLELVFAFRTVDLLKSIYERANGDQSLKTKASKFAKKRGLVLLPISKNL